MKVWVRRTWSFAALPLSGLVVTLLSGFLLVLADAPGPYGIHGPSMARSSLLFNAGLQAPISAIEALGWAPTGIPVDLSRDTPQKAPPVTSTFEQIGIFAGILTFWGALAQLAKALSNRAWSAFISTKHFKGRVAITWTMGIALASMGFIGLGMLMSRAMAL